MGGYAKSNAKIWVEGETAGNGGIGRNRARHWKHSPCAGQQQALVTQGATLIDGNGSAPVPNSVIIIQANRITAVGRAGHRPYSVPYAFSTESAHPSSVAEN